MPDNVMILRKRNELKARLKLKQPAGRLFKYEARNEKRRIRGGVGAGPDNAHTMEPRVVPKMFKIPSRKKT